MERLAADIPPVTVGGRSVARGGADVAIEYPCHRHAAETTAAGALARPPAIDLATRTTRQRACWLASD
jgi:hypothetical protein